MQSKIFAHSRLDGLLVLLALVQFAVLLFGALTFGAVPRWQSLVAGLISVYLTTTNFKCIAHNFIHNPFFRSRRLNGAYSVFNSLLLGGPQALYRLHHLNHHRYNNDPPDPATGTTGDLSSTWRYSRWPGLEEGFLSYALLGYFRTDFGLLLGEARKKRLILRVYGEFAAVLALVAAVGWLNPPGLAFFYLPVWYFGNAAAQAENYLEHYGALPGNRKTDSVSSYGALYNLLRFNHGYHQEHHYRPQVHWTRVPGMKELLPPETDRRVVRWAHWFNFGDVRRSRPRVAPDQYARGGVLNISRGPSWHLHSKTGEYR
jgi:fatty acid desaturase